VSMSDELKECNILKLIVIVRFACATLEVGHPIEQFLRFDDLGMACHMSNQVNTGVAVEHMRSFRP
jgi:hypothetical protein